MCGRVLAVANVGQECAVCHAGLPVCAHARTSARAHAHTHRHTDTHTRAHTHARTHTFLGRSLIVRYLDVAFGQQKSLQLFPEHAIALWHPESRKQDDKKIGKQDHIAELIKKLGVKCKPSEVRFSALAR
jgi:hypothetical protein